MRYCRSVVETCSSYVLMPAMFMFVLNVWPASFAQAETSSRVMIVATPAIALLSRWLVIHKRLVPLTRGDQQQLFVSCVCNCGIAVVLAAYFVREEADAAYASDPSPQYIVLALLVVQLLGHTVIRHHAAEASLFDSMNWPWQSAAAGASAIFSFSELRTRLMLGFAVPTLALATRFLLVNYVILSQMVMVIAGLVSSGSSSSSTINAASVAIGVIPLIISSVVLLRTVVKIVRLLWLLKQKLIKRPPKVELL